MDPLHQLEAVFLCGVAELFQSGFVAAPFPIGGFKRPNVLTQEAVAFPHNPLGLRFAFRMLHHEVECLLIDVSEKGMDGTLDVVKRQQRGRFWL